MNSLIDRQTDSVCLYNTMLIVLMQLNFNMMSANSVPSNNTQQSTNKCHFDIQFSLQ